MIRKIILLLLLTIVMLDVYSINIGKNCSSNPCLNNGTCVSVQNVYRCQCVTPFYGERCEQCLCFNNNTCSEYGPNICYSIIYRNIFCH